jgi:poly(hydroxyalkanoate) granule-associated protein
MWSRRTAGSPTPLERRSEIKEIEMNVALNAGRSLWLAGLGAAAGVEAVGRELFGQLVERGRPVEEKQKKVVTEVADRTGRTVRELGKLVQDTVEFESKGMLKRVGVITRDDVKILSARLDTLSRKLDEYAAIQEISADDTDETIADEAPKARRPRQRKKKG